MFIRHLWLARLYLLATDLPGKLFGGYLSITMHEHDERFFELVFHDERFNDGVFINPQRSGGDTGATMHFIGVQVVGERYPVRFQKQRRLSGGALGVFHRSALALRLRLFDKYHRMSIFDIITSLTLLHKEAQMGMNINLTETLEEMVRNKVATGLYNSASEVIRDALRLMQEQDEYRAVRLNQLKSAVQQGLDSGPSEPLDMNALKQQLRTQVPRKTKTAA